jgi:hypothetical protein
MKENTPLPEIPSDVTGGNRIFDENIRSYLQDFRQDLYDSTDGKGWTGSFTNGDGDTVTVEKGLITDVS